MKGRTVVFTVNNVQKELCSLLKEKGINTVGADRLPEAYPKDFFKVFDNVIFPFPLKENNLGFIPKGTDLCEILSPHQRLIGGMISEKIRNEAEKSGAEYADYFDDEAYVLKNAFITSQGALKLMLDSTTEYIVGKRVLITGFGRIGKALARTLKALGMTVFIGARGELARAEAIACGYEAFAISQLCGTLFYYDYIFNTVPERIFTQQYIKHIRDDALYFEIASKPCGADEKDFTDSDKIFIDGGALPGKYLPSAVAQNIYDYLLRQEAIKWKVLK